MEFLMNNNNYNNKLHLEVYPNFNKVEILKLCQSAKDIKIW